MSGRTHKLRSSRLVARQRKVFIGRLIFTLIVFFTCWEFIFWFTGLPVFLIKTVDVSGVVSLQVADIERVANDHLKGKYYFTIPKFNIFFYPKNLISRDLKSTFPELESVRVSRVNFRNINIFISERKVHSLWCQGQAIEGEGVGKEVCYFQDSDGYIFAFANSSAETFANFIKYYSLSPKEKPIGQNYIDSENFKKLNSFVSELKRVGLKSLYIKENSSSVFEAGLLGGQRILFNLDSDLANVLSNLESIIADQNFGLNTFAKVDYIDLRFGNKIFYKLK